MIFVSTCSQVMWQLFLIEHFSQFQKKYMFYHLRLGDSQPLGDGNGMAMTDLLAAALNRIKELEKPLASHDSVSSGSRPELRRATHIDSPETLEDGISKKMCLKNLPFPTFYFKCFEIISSQTKILETLYIVLPLNSLGQMLQPLQELLPDRQPDEPFAQSPASNGAAGGGNSGGSGGDHQQALGGASTKSLEDVKPKDDPNVTPKDVPNKDPLDTLPELNALILQNRARADELPKEPTPDKGKDINWVTHKKEGMRLKRLMEESSDGRKFPHMQEMWNGSTADSWFWEKSWFISVLFLVTEHKRYTSQISQPQPKFVFALRIAKSFSSNGWKHNRILAALRLTW